MTSRTPRRHPRAARLNEREWRRVCAFAAGQSVAPAEGLRRLVLVGLQASEGVRRSVGAEIEECVGRLLGLMERVGPAMVGLPHLLAYWATRDEGQDAGAAQLIAEFEHNAAVLWGEALRSRGIEIADTGEEVLQNA